MNGKTYLYLELAALPAVGAVLLDPRPAFVFAADGQSVLLANAAGMAFLDEERMAAVLARRFAAGSPLARHLARLSKLLPSDHPRLEMLRFNRGGGPVALAAACLRLNLADGSRAVLAIGMTDAHRESLAGRAEQLTDAIASRDCLVAVFGKEGRVLAASGGFADVTPASAVIDDLVEEAARSDDRLLRRKLVIDGATRPVGIARFEAGAQPLHLLIVGPEEAAAAEVAPRMIDATPVAAAAQTEPVQIAEGPVAADPVAEPASADVATAEVPRAGEISVPVAGPLPETAPAERAAGPSPLPASVEAPPASVMPAPRVRFLWELDHDLRFTFVSPELADSVGLGNAAVVGRDWDELAAGLALDPGAKVAAALATHASWSGLSVAWPVEGKPEAVAIDLAAFAVTAPHRHFAGFRGLGTVRPEERTPLAEPVTLRPKSPVPEAEEAAVAEAVAIALAPPEEPAPAAVESADATEPVGVSSPEPESPQPAEIVAAPAPEPAAEPAAQAEPSPGEEPAAIGRRPDHPPLVLSEEDIDDAARKSIEEGRRPPTQAPGELVEMPLAEDEPPATRPAVMPAAQPAASNVVRLPGQPTRTPPERLTGSEQDAFRRIAEALGVKMTDDIEEAAAEARRRASDVRTPPAAVAAAASEVDARILDKLPSGIVVYRDRRTLFANRALLEMLGYDSADAFALAGGAELIFPEPHDGGPRPALSEGGGTLQARRRDGGTVPVEARLHAVPWSGATALMLSLVKRAEARQEPVSDEALLDHLIHAERRIDELEAILDTATDGIVVIDKDGTIDNINRSAEALFGIEATEVLRQPFVSLFAEESRKAALDYLDGLAENGVASVLNDGREVIGRVPKGGLIPMFMTMGRLGDGPKFCAVLRDITHWKNVEEELVAAKRSAETANAQKSEFLAKISHEIRTPLNAIIGFSEVMMEERFGAVGNERYRDYLRDIHVSGTHMLSLINDLLDLSKIEAGKLELAFESVAVNEIIQECVALMQPQANRERIIIRTSLSAGVPNVVADERSLRQILLNLLSNAIKFTGAGGQVIVATALEENGEVTLRIRDTGIGMSDKDIETALKPFRQVGSRGRGRGEGTGLGLPLTKALVEANRASFTIDSAPNQGTLVKVTFPTTRVLAG